ncbi:MAG: lysophospholipid acyltransferase family protein, partial [Bacillota bacterium]|nr:lysophospholipid acyltransferase family protein [Bacillota bacterium]
AISIFPREIHYMAKKELFKNSLVAAFLRSLHAFPVDRDAPGPSSLKIPLGLLKKGETVGIFPTGTRTVNNSLKQGAVTIAQMAKAPLVPVVYKGPVGLKAKNFFARETASITIGEPVHYHNLTGQNAKEKKEKIKEDTLELENIFNQLEKEAT